MSFTSLLPSSTLVPQFFWGTHRTGTELVNTAFEGHAMEMEVTSNTLAPVTDAYISKTFRSLQTQERNAHVSPNTERYLSLQSSYTTFSSVNTTFAALILIHIKSCHKSHQIKLFALPCPDNPIATEYELFLKCL